MLTVYQAHNLGSFPRVPWNVKYLLKSDPYRLKDGTRKGRRFGDVFLKNLEILKSCGTNHGSA